MPFNIGDKVLVEYLGGKRSGVIVDGSGYSIYFKPESLTHRAVRLDGVSYHSSLEEGGFHGFMIGELEMLTPFEGELEFNV